MAKAIWFRLALFGTVFAPPLPVAAQQPVASTASTPLVGGADHWLVYGSQASLQRDTTVVGAGSVVVAPLGRAAPPWTSGAVAPIPQALTVGQRITIAFWAKSVTQENVILSLQANQAPYAAFLSERILLTPQWRRLVRTATVPGPLAAGTQQIALQLGEARAAVTLGPYAILDGSARSAQIDAAFAAFRPDRATETVSISSDPGVTLAGTLRTPTGHGRGPFPLAILIQGHGRNGRGGYDVLMSRLLADGIATLEYDKRGIGASTGIYSEDREALTRDARAAVAAMRRRPEIDGARIALIGHSQGGAIVPAVAATDPRIAAIVSFAGPVGDGVELFRRSMHDQLVGAGRSEATVVPLVDAAVALLRARADHADNAALAGLRATAIAGFVANGFTREQAAGALAAIDSDEIQSILQAHIASDLRALHIPVLALFAALDPIVAAQGNAAAAREALAHNPAARVVVLDGLSHWFKEGARTGSEEENATLGPNLGSPRAVAIAGDWLRGVLAPAPPRP